MHEIRDIAGIIARGACSWEPFARRDFQSVEAGKQRVRSEHGEEHLYARR
jgi:hypothetical protein